MKRAMNIIETLINEYPEELTKVVTDNSKKLIEYKEGEITVDKDFMKIFSTIAYAHYDNPSKYFINKDDCMRVVEPYTGFSPVCIVNYMADIENGDFNMLRKTCTFLFVLGNFCQHEQKKPVDVLKYIHDNPAEKKRNIKTKLKALLKIHKYDYDIVTSNFNVGLLSVLSNKRVQDIITDISNHYFKE